MPDQQPDQERTRRRKVLKSVGAAGMVGLAGCSQGSDTQTPTSVANGDQGRYDVNPDNWKDLEGQEVHLVTQQSSEFMRSFWQNLGGAFQQATGGFLRLEYTGFASGIRERIAQLLQAGEPPDIAYVDKLMAPTFAAQGIMADHTEIVDHMKDTYGPFADVTRVVRNGNDRMLPILMTNMVEWYRDDVLTEAPTTWSKQLQQAKEHDDPNGMRGMATVVQRGQCSQNNLIAKAYENGGRIAGRDDNGDVEVVMDQGDQRDRWIEALEHSKQLYQYSNKNTDVGCVGNLEALATELGAQTYFVGTRPKDAVADSPFGEEVSAVRSPQPDNSDNGKHWTIVAGYGAFKDGNTEAATEFMKFMSQPKYLFDIYMDPPLMWTPTIPDMLDDDRYHSRLDEHLGDHFKQEDRETLIELSKNVDENGLPTAAETEPDNEYTNVIYESLLIADLKYDVLVEGTDPGSAVDTYADEIRQVIEDADF